LIYYAIDSWFIAVTKIKDKMIKNNKKINWYPSHIKEGRFGKWLDGIKDWNLSRFKFWGTPLPVWRCECKKEKIIGSVEELRKESVKKFKDYDLHRPWVDKIKIKCKCGKEMTRVADLIDVWYDSGSASFAQFHYPFENKKEFEKRMPYDYIAEAIDQTRGWFYTLHAISSMLFNNISYKNVICAGHLVDENSEKMSKSKGNVINPSEMIDKVGIDAVRLQFCTVDVGNQKRFSENLVKEAVLPFLNVLSNCKTFYIQAENKKLKSKQIEDRWILSRLNTIIKQTTEDLENYSLDKALLRLMDFVVNDFSRTYIKITRDRENTREILKEVLHKVSLLLAPYAPYISEDIYQCFDKQSVHLSKWPKADLKLINNKLEKEFEVIMEVIEKGLAERDKAQIGLKWPLSNAKIIITSTISKQLQEIIKSQLNVKNTEIKKGKQISVKLDTKLTPELESEGYARVISRQVQALRKKAGLVKTNKIKLGLIVDDNFKKIIEKQINMIKQRTNAQEVVVGKVSNIKESDYSNSSKEKVKNKEFKILLKKI